MNYKFLIVSLLFCIPCKAMSPKDSVVDSPNQSQAMVRDETAVQDKIVKCSWQLMGKIFCITYKRLKNGKRSSSERRKVDQSTTVLGRESLSTLILSGFSGEIVPMEIGFE